LEKKQEIVPSVRYNSFPKSQPTEHIRMLKIVLAIYLTALCVNVFAANTTTTGSWSASIDNHNKITTGNGSVTYSYWLPIPDFQSKFSNDSITILYSYKLEFNASYLGTNLSTILDYTVTSARSKKNITEFNSSTSIVIPENVRWAGSESISQCDYRENTPTGFNMVVNVSGIAFDSATLNASMTVIIMGPVNEYNYTEGFVNTEGFVDPVFNLMLPVVPVNKELRFIAKSFKGPVYAITLRSNCGNLSRTKVLSYNDTMTGLAENISEFANSNHTTMISVEIFGSLGEQGSYFYFTTELVDHASGNNNGSTNLPLIIGILVAVVAVLGIGAYCFWKRRQGSGYQPLLGRDNK